MLAVHLKYDLHTFTYLMSDNVASYSTRTSPCLSKSAAAALERLQRWDAVCLSASRCCCCNCAVNLHQAAFTHWQSTHVLPPGATACTRAWRTSLVLPHPSSLASSWRALNKSHIVSSIIGFGLKFSRIKVKVKVRMGLQQI